MIHEIFYKGQKINLKDIELTWSDRFGEMIRGTVEDFGIDNYQEGYAEAEAGEGW
jgi:hypothetical protein